MVDVLPHYEVEEVPLVLKFFGFLLCMDIGFGQMPFSASIEVLSLFILMHDIN